MTSQPLKNTADISQCPTCRADVTVSPGDMSASTTLTPVVDAQAVRTDYGATGTVTGEGAEAPDGGSRLAWLGEMRDRVIARAGVAVTSVNDSLRAIVRGDNAPLARPALDERTPLRGTDV